MPSRVCPNPSVAGQRSLGSRPTSDVLARGVRRHSHNQSTRNERATGAKRRADDVPTTEQGKQDTGDADYAHWTQKPDATAPHRGGLPLSVRRVSHMVVEELLARCLYIPQALAKVVRGHSYSILWVGAPFLMLG